MGVSALNKWGAMPPPPPPPGRFHHLCCGIEWPFWTTVIKVAILGMVYLDLTARRGTECKLINSKFAKVLD